MNPVADEQLASSSENGTIEESAPTVKPAKANGMKSANAASDRAEERNGIPQRATAKPAAKKKVAAVKKPAAKKAAAKSKPTAKRAGKPAAKVSRPYPRATLDRALKIPVAIKKENAGNPFSTESVAEAVGLAKSNPDFFYMAAASRDFGLTTGSRDTNEIALTDLGRDLVYAPSPDAEQAKKMEAFLSVELFKKVLEYYKGSNLPDMKYLGNVLQNQFGLHPETHEEFSTLFKKNCEFLGIGDGLPNISEVRPPARSFMDVGDRSTVLLAEPETATGLSCFVILPFRERDSIHPEGFFTEVVKSLITPAARSAGFSVKSANRRGSDVIQSTILHALIEADLVIADLTEHNPNVLFELGVRIMVDKPVALIRATGTPQIFDVDNLVRVYDYSPNLWPSTIERDLEALQEHIAETWAERESGKSYRKLLLKEKGEV